MIKPPRNRHAAKLPKFWRPRLTQSQVLQASIVHHDLLATLEAGGASGAVLFDWMESCATYLQMMRLLEEDGTEFTEDAKQAIAQAVDDTASVAERFRRIGRVGFSGPELNITREAVAVMDELLELDRHGIAEQAARWSIEQMANVRRA